MIMLGKVDSEGKVEAILLKNINKNINLRVTGSFQSSNVDQGILAADLDIEGKTSIKGRQEFDDCNETRSRTLRT